MIIGAAGWLDEAAPLLRAAIITIENLFDPETIIVGGLTGGNVMAQLLDRLEPLPNSVSQRHGRKAARITRAADGPDAVLRGAASLAIAGVLSPRFGTMFAQGEARDPLLNPVKAA